MTTTQRKPARAGKGGDELPATLRGTVTRYKGNGRKLGYPTANFQTDTRLVDGVYFGTADLGHYHDHPAIIFLGTPTTMGDTTRRVEAYLIGVPDLDYYDESIELELMYYHRRNRTFESVAELVGAITYDEEIAKSWFLRRGVKT